MTSPKLASGAERWIALACIPALAALTGSAAAMMDPGAPATVMVSLAVAFAPLPLAVALFFRDPERVPPEEEGVVSPADGRVQRVDVDDGRSTLVVFMRLRDVHVNRSPVDAEVVEVEHVAGGHLPAFSKSSSRNERVETTLEAEDGVYEVVQIAGALARRITTYVDEGDVLDRGERLGQIAFSSRVDLTLPERYTLDDLEVDEGDVVRAGETLVADGARDG